MELKKLPVGVDSFEEIRNGDWYYVDKSLLIKELLDNGAKVNLFTRPRRFGKTLNLKMLKCFFEKKPKDVSDNLVDNRKLFEGLGIMASGEKYLRHMGKYPVIFLTLKSGKQPDWELAYRRMIREVANEFRRHIGILESPKLLNAEKEEYLRIAEQKSDRANDVQALEFLSVCLEKVYEEKVIILIDEYDVPLENAYFENFYAEMTGFVRALFESALKSNEALFFAVLTGCLRVSKESIFTGLNNLEIISIRNSSYAEHFGFVQREVDEMLTNYGLCDQSENVKDWYDGYLFGKTEVYNPWSVINYVKSRHLNQDVKPEPYWANTSGNNIVKSLIEKADLETKREMEILIAGGTIEKPIHDEITYDDIEKSMDHLWNFLFFTGYLKKVSERWEDCTTYVTMCIPNHEIRYIYENQIRGWFMEILKTVDKSKLFAAVLSGDAVTLATELTSLLSDTISYMDNHENFYHGFVVGALAGMPDHLVKSNRESGNGRSDIVILSKDYRKAIIIELKVSVTKMGLSTKCEEALKQIEEKGYAEELKGDYDQILSYGLAFWKKKCMGTYLTIE